MSSSGGRLENTNNVDVFIVDNADLIDLESPDSDDFPFCGSPVEIEEEMQQIEKLLMKPTPPGLLSLPIHAAAPLQRSCSDVKPRKPKHQMNQAVVLPVASYGHNAQRVKAIKEENGRLVQRLVGMANAPVTIKTTAKEHDKHVARVMASTLHRRQKEEDAIMGNNLWLYNRLQGARPSADLNRKELLKQYTTSRQYVFTTKRESVKPVPPGMSQSSAWDDRWQVRPSSC